MSMNIDEIAAPDGESFKFDNVGDTIQGVIIDARKEVRENRFNNFMEEVLIITLETSDGETRKIFPVTDTNVDPDAESWPSKMARAVVAAVRAAGETTLENGGTLAVAFTDTKPTDKGNPAKLYAAEYQPPAVSASDAAAADGAVKGLING